MECRVCGEAPSDEPWLMLNRWAFGTGACQSIKETFVDGKEVWEIGDEDEEDEVCGVWLCWPRCAVEYIEASMVETNVVMRMRNGG